MNEQYYTPGRLNQSIKLSSIQRDPLSSHSAASIGVCDTAKCGIDPIPSKYRASIANTGTFYVEKQFIYITFSHLAGALIQSDLQ